MFLLIFPQNPFKIARAKYIPKLVDIFICLKVLYAWKCHSSPNSNQIKSNNYMQVCIIIIPLLLQQPSYPNLESKVVKQLCCGSIESGQTAVCYQPGAWLKQGDWFHKITQFRNDGNYKARDGNYISPLYHFYPISTGAWKSWLRGWRCLSAATLWRSSAILWSS